MNVKEPVKPVMQIPYLRDLNDGTPKLRTKVEAQLAAAAMQLAGANFHRWDRRMLKPAIERWDAHELRFVGLTLDDFCFAIELLFDLQTSDGRSWRLDRVLASKLWEAAIKPDVLPVASWSVQLERQRQAEKEKGEYARR